jgi:hypothetical protein
MTTIEDEGWTARRALCMAPFPRNDTTPPQGWGRWYVSEEHEGPVGAYLQVVTVSSYKERLG